MSNAAILARWNEPGPAGFTNWLADVRPCILHGDNRYRPVVLEPWQENIIHQALGTGQHSICLAVTPRRHSKSTLWALVVLWLATSRPNFQAGVLGNNEQHTNRVQMRLLRRIIRNTPALFKMAGGESGLSRWEIRFPTMGSMILALTPTAQSAYGDRLNCLWISDLHAAPDMDVIHAVQASLLDSAERLTLIDSNVDHEGGPVHELERAAQEDPGIFVHRTEYKDFNDYLLNAPSWINRDEARRLQKVTLPVAFDRDILGKRSSATNSLFPPEVITVCKSDFPAPVSPAALKLLVGGRQYVIGLGLDRSKSMFGGDNTIVTATAKVATDSGEPEYFILQQEAIIPNTASLLKRFIIKAHEAYKIDNCTLENYEAIDIAPWLNDQGIACELVSAHSTNQNAIFPELHRIAKEGRLHFSKDDQDLVKELQTFVYTQQKGGQYSFGHSSQKFKDDRVYSLAWSIWATRANVLNLFTMGNIQCNSRSPHRSMCFLMGGDLELLCKDTCRAYHEAKALYQDYRRLRMDDDTITIAEFFNNRVKLVGARIYQGV